MNPGIHRAVARIPQTSLRATSATPFTCKRQSPLQYSLYSTTNSSTSSVSSSPSSKAAPSSPSSRFSNWIQRITLMSASAAAGAFVYAKFDPAIGGFSGLPVGKLQPTILGTEEPDEPFDSATPVTQEKAKELKKSVLLEHEMHQLEIVHQYKDKVAAGEWKEADPYFFLTDHTKKHNLTAGALRGENMLSVPPLKFERKDKKAIVLFLHLGRSLCGHDKIIHGGLLATLLDEATGMVALPNLPFHIGFTANLNVNYRRPVTADQFVMVTAEFEKGEGRKGYTNASIRDLEGNTLVECTALFVSPKNPVTMIINFVKNSLGFGTSPAA
ncbi:hypothetical protein BGZ82_004596 [Podila clonocystis]|nr:hypothetical protein BGZ82_004596 [Podila clonocystis]